MNIDIQTEHVHMQPDWHRMIDAWVDRCRRQYPDVASIDVQLRHAEQDGLPEMATIGATTGGRRLRGSCGAPMMSMALHDALDAVERELLVHEALTRRV
jgi:ribosome-associated translation inhibitor RaiA